MTDRRDDDTEAFGTASRAVLEQDARSPLGQMTVWFSAVSLLLGVGVGGWLLLHAFEAARHRPPAGLLDLFTWIIGN